MAVRKAMKQITRIQGGGNAIESGDAFRFGEGLGAAAKRAKRLVGDRVAQDGEDGIRSEGRELSQRIIGGREKRQGSLFGTYAAKILRRGTKSSLLTATDKNPFGDARLNIGFDPVVNDFHHLFSDVGQVVEAGQFERFERRLRASRKVVEHRLRGFHTHPPVSLEQPDSSDVSDCII